jgi:hypothetical protein
MPSDDVPPPSVIRRCKVLGAPGELGERYVDGTRELQKVRQAGIPLAALDATNVRAIELREVREAFLRQPTLGSQSSQGSAVGEMGV